MMFKKRAKSLVSVLLALIMVLSIFPMTVLAAVDMDESALPSDTYLISKTDYQIAPGIEETQFLINNAEMARIRMPVLPSPLNWAARRP